MSQASERPYPRQLLLENSAAYRQHDQAEILRLAQTLRQMTVESIRLFQHVDRSAFADTIRLREAELSYFDELLAVDRHEKPTH